MTLENPDIKIKRFQEMIYVHIVLPSVEFQLREIRKDLLEIEKEFQILKKNLLTQ